jgi:hypothetical protein
MVTSGVVSTDLQPVEAAPLIHANPSTYLHTAPRVSPQTLASLGGYLTHGSHVFLERVETFIQRVGQYEDAIFQKRMKHLVRWGPGAGVCERAGVYALSCC